MYDSGMGPGAWRVGVVSGSLALVACGPRYEMRTPEEPVLATRANARQTSTSDPSPTGSPAGSRPDQVGMASWYGSALAGRKTANGERFDPTQYTAAHRQLPFGTWVEVRRIDTGHSVRVRVNDRGPNGRAQSRIIDISRRAAEDLDIVRAGVVKVELRIVDGP